LAALGLFIAVSAVGGHNIDGPKGAVMLDAAKGDDQTVLPDGLTQPAYWSKAEENEGPPAAQPDHTGHAPAAGDAPGSAK
jgi:hypothetical protein